MRGYLREMTKGEGVPGDADTLLYVFHYGTNPS